MDDWLGKKLKMEDLGKILNEELLKEAYMRGYQEAMQEVIDRWIKMGNGGSK